jgi:hypothetical protein
MNYTNLTPETLISLLSICDSYIYREHYNGHHWRFFLANDFYVSLAKHEGTYGEERDLWEVALLQHRENDNWSFCYSDEDKIAKFLPEFVEGICPACSEEDVLNLVRRVEQL